MSGHAAHGIMSSASLVDSCHEHVSESLAVDCSFLVAVRMYLHCPSRQLGTVLSKASAIAYTLSDPFRTASSHTPPLKCCACGTIVVVNIESVQTSLCPVIVCVTIDGICKSWAS